MTDRRQPKKVTTTDWLAIAVILGSLVVVSSVAQAQSTTYEEVLKGKHCHESENQQLNCEYKIGHDLHISIPGIGLPDTGITIMKADFDGDFYVTFGIMHGCLIVKRGPKNRSDELLGPGSMMDFAFISPRNGKVYTSWRECRSGM